MDSGLFFFILAVVNYAAVSMGFQVPLSSIDFAAF